MRSLSLQAPSRLHFGLLAWGDRAPRQFGGVGLMIDRPGLSVSATLADRWSFRGPLSGRAEGIARDLVDRGISTPPLRVEIHHAPPEHSGLGAGTGLSLAIARILTEFSGRSDTPAPVLAALTGRGRRSGIGLHGFDLGGLIVDGGHGPGSTPGSSPPPLLARLDLPESWRVLVVLPGGPSGLHGPEEARAFRALPPIPEAETDRLCRIVLLGLLPSAAEGDLPRFGSALEDLQSRVGRLFAPAQGGSIYAHPESGAILEALRAEGLVGLGQSSWGPALYGFADDPDAPRSALADRIAARFALPPDRLFWARLSPWGVSVERNLDAP